MNRAHSPGSTKTQNLTGLRDLSGLFSEEVIIMKTTAMHQRAVNWLLRFVFICALFPAMTIVTQTTSAAEDLIATKPEDIVGIWEAQHSGRKAYVQYRTDGTYSIAYALENLQRSPLLMGKIWFEEKVYFQKGEHPVYSYQFPGKYEVRVHKEEGMSNRLSFQVIDDDGSRRVKDLTAGMTRVEASFQSLETSPQAVDEIVNKHENFGNSEGLLWKFETGTPLAAFTHGQLGATSCAVTDTVVYFGGIDGNLYAVDRQSGQELWRFETGGSVYAQPPALVDDVIYFGSFDRHLYAVNAETGDEKWRFETGGKVSTSPAIVNKVMYFGSLDHNFYAVDIETGQELWRFETGDQVDSCPAIFGGMAIFGSWDDHFYAVDINTGQERWKVETGYHRFGNSSSPIIVDGVVYIGSDDQHLYALDPETGQEIWRSKTNGNTPSSPAFGDGMVYIGSNDSHLYAIDSYTGAERWKFPTQGFVFSSPAFIDGVVYVGSQDRNLYAIDSQSGQGLWRFETQGEVLGSPVVADGVVYFLSGDGNFYAVRTE